MIKRLHQLLRLALLLSVTFCLSGCLALTASKDVATATAQVATDVVADTVSSVI